ncbi:hypothetical protein C8J56DRAFT_924604 [Mycena floridula]|nr:hypothetical protein C8J56DRAFT_924604 [Mycena floridula]
MRCRSDLGVAAFRFCVVRLERNRVSRFGDHVEENVGLRFRMASGLLSVGRTGSIAGGRPGRGSGTSKAFPRPILTNLADHPSSTSNSTTPIPQTAILPMESDYLEILCSVIPFLPRRHIVLVVISNNVMANVRGKRPRDERKAKLSKQLETRAIQTILRPPPTKTSSFPVQWGRVGSVGGGLVTFRFLCLDGVATGQLYLLRIR